FRRAGGATRHRPRRTGCRVLGRQRRIPRGQWRQPLPGRRPASPRGARQARAGGVREERTGGVREHTGRARGRLRDDRRHAAGRSDRARREAGRGGRARRRAREHELLAVRCADLSDVSCSRAIAARRDRASGRRTTRPCARRVVPDRPCRRGRAGSVESRRHCRGDAAPGAAGGATVTTFVSRRRIAGAGFAATDLAARTALIDRAESALRGATGAPPQWTWFVPGRIEVLGKHTDYAGGASLVAAVPRGFAVAATPRDDGTIAVTDARWATQAVIEPGTTGDVRGWARYVAVVARRFADNFPGASLGVDVAIASDLPRAAGLSSSSALIVAMALVLARRGRLDTRPEWREAIRTPLDLAAYLGAVEAGRGFRGLRAAGGVGTKGGSEDHTAILASAPERLRAFTCLPMQALGEAAMP